MLEGEQQKRDLAWDACYNAREVGGYPTADGGHTRWRALVRTDNLQRLTPEGKVELRDYGVRTVIDLRSAHELERDPDPFAVHQGLDGMPRYLNLPLVDYEDREATADMEATETMAAEYIVILERNKERIAAVIKAVAASLDEGAVLVHCHGGKDRTGIIVAFLLSLAGVPRDTVVEDYAVSEVRLEPVHLAWLEEQRQANGGPIDRPRWMGSRPETMRTVLEYLDREYGGVDGYLTKSGVTQHEIARIREHLIAPADELSS